MVLRIPDGIPWGHSAGVNAVVRGQPVGMDQPTGAQEPSERAHAAPSVDAAMTDGTLRLTVAGELTDAARRPLVRVVTDRLLAEPDLHRVELDLRGVGFVNSAGLAVLVQLQRLGAPRAIEIVLVAPPVSVVRPLQLTGLWTRFPVTEHGGS